MALYPFTFSDFAFSSPGAIPTRILEFGEFSGVTLRDSPANAFGVDPDSGVTVDGSGVHGGRFSGVTIG